MVPPNWALYHLSVPEQFEAVNVKDDGEQLDCEDGVTVGEGGGVPGVTVRSIVLL